jgi:hypothetical protein
MTGGGTVSLFRQEDYQMKLPNAGPAAGRRRQGSLWRPLLTLAALVTVCLGYTWISPRVPNVSAGQTEKSPYYRPIPDFTSGHKGHKVVTQGGAAAKFAPAGRVADYGSFQVYRIDDGQAKAAASIPGAEIHDEFDVIYLNATPIDTTTDNARLLNAQVAERGKRGGGSGLYLVQFAGPIRDEWIDGLKEGGVQIINYIPNNAYLVKADGAGLAAMGKMTGAVQFMAPYLDWMKFHPDALPYDLKGNAKAQIGDGYKIQLAADKVLNAETMALLDAIKVGDIPGSYAYSQYVNLNVRLTPENAQRIAERPDVISIHPFIPMHKMDERQDMILAGNLTAGVPNTGSYLTQLSNWGFTQAQFNASGFIVDVTDDGADRNPTGADPGTIPQDSNTGPVMARHFVLYELGQRLIGDTVPTGTSRFAYKSRWGTGSTTDAGLGVSGHGQLNMSIVGGYVPNGTVGGVNFNAAPHADASGFHFGLGVAPFVKLANSVIFDPNFTSPPLANMLSAGYTSGTRISSNSWGSNAGGAYTSDSQTYDGLVRDSQSGTAGNQQMIITFSAGNAGSGANTIGAPATGKNVFCVGAAENVQAFGGADGCGTTDAEADNANDVVGFSSRGPCDDGRIKPDIQAPGTHISGMTFVQLGTTGNGTAEATYRADGVCAGPGGSNFFPTTQQWYTASSGTSHSNPAVAGGSALVYQQFINNPSYIATNRVPAGSAPPSPAMNKAYIVNSARYMTGVSANDTLPSNNQGFGMMNLGTAFDGTPRIIRDQVAGDTFGNTGELRVFGAQVTDGSKPFRVTLAFTDAPGATSGNAFVNNLDLEVIAGGNTYLGNVFTGANSTTGGTADPRDNVESVFIPGGTLATGTQVLIRVRATNIAGDGVPGNADTTDQDFALVAYNANPAVVNALLTQGTPTVITGNNIIEPNECNSMNIPLSNASPDTGATAVSATLSTTTPGVTITTATSAYPDIAAGGTQTNTTPFQVSTTNAVACGTTINFTLTVNFTGGASPATFNFTQLVGQPANPNYTFTSTTGTISSTGTLVSTASQDDDAVVTTTTPFAFTVYGNAVTSGQTISLSTNGTLQFIASGGSTSLTNGALPATAFGATTTVLMPYWDDLDMRTTITTGGGIYTETTGTAPNRTFKVEWRARHFVSGQTLGAPDTNFAILFHEGSDNFEYVYALAGAGANAGGVSATVGVQAATTGTTFTQFSNNTASLTNGQQLNAARAAGICTPGTGGCGSTCPTITVTPATLPNGTVGTPYPTQNFAGSGGVGPYSFSVTGGTLPAGLTLSSAGVLSGTPTATGTSNFSVVATDANTCTGIVTFTGVTVVSANVSRGAVTVTSNSGIVQPNACNTLTVALNNSGSGPATGVSGTLSTTTPGVTVTTGTSAYPTLAAGSSGTINTTPFQFSTDNTVACGSNISFTLTVTYVGGGSPSVFNFTQTVGTLATAFSENFDGVTVPALPAGWTTQQTGTSPPAVWATTATGADSAPNVAFTNGSTSVSSNSLVSPAIALPAGPNATTFTFRHAWNFESATSSFDGGVLELTTDGGTTFNDVTSGAVGGTFTAGGYTGTISSSFSNPLGGRAAWVRQQTAYVTSTLSLPATLNGQTIMFRWRAGFDSSTAATNPNWRIDTMSLSGGFTCTPGTGGCGGGPTCGTPSIVNSLVSFSGSGALAAPTCGAQGYSNDYVLNAVITNTSAQTLCSLSCQVVELAETGGVPPTVPFRLISADSATCSSGGLVGSIQTITTPTTLAPGQSANVTFRIALPTARRFRFTMNVIGGIQSGGFSAIPAAKSLTALNAPLTFDIDNGKVARTTRTTDVAGARVNQPAALRRK